jgi:hypothetical protein
MLLGEKIVLVPWLGQMAPANVEESDLEPYELKLPTRNCGRDRGGRRATGKIIAPV